MSPTATHYDVVIIGGGLAGQALSRQLLMNTSKKILLLERQNQIPSPRQKYGESLVQVGGYYFSKVLEMEEYLLREHYMKYNLRFYWKSGNRTNRHFEDFGQSFIRTMSNIPCYQLNRNTLEGELFRRNQQSPHFTAKITATVMEVLLSDVGPHTVVYKKDGQTTTVTADWVVDTSGRGKHLARRLDIAQDNPIHHGASFFWVEGLVDIEKLTDLSPAGRRLNPNRRNVGHLPLFLATNHFCGEGLWFWVIPLQGITSLGLVYDNRLIAAEDVFTPEKLIAWVCREFPLFERDLPHRKVLDAGFIRSYSHGCDQTIHKSRWALSGESGRFTDPLYSPGSDFIAIHNTLITDAIMTDDPEELAGKCLFYEMVERSYYESLLPTYAITYDALGDQEVFALKYTWELSVYFSFFVFPMINDLLTDRRFMASLLGKFSRLGKVNRNLQQFLSDYYQWKKRHRTPPPEPLFHDFSRTGTLRKAESVFYQVGLSVDEARKVVDEQLTSLLELARFVYAYVSSNLLSDPDILTDRSFVEGIDPQHFRFDPADMRRRYEACDRTPGSYTWSFDPFIFEHFRPSEHDGVKQSTVMSV